MKRQAIRTTMRAKQAGVTLIELTAALATAVIYASFQWAAASLGSLY